jgi:hypothetical protein
MRKSPTIGLDTKAEQDRAYAMANGAAAAGTAARQRGDSAAYERSVGYLMAIQDLAMDEGAPDLAGKIRFMLRDLGITQ